MVPKSGVIMSLVKPAVQDAERRVFVPGDDDQLMIGTEAGITPDKQPVRGDEA